MIIFNMRAFYVVPEYNMPTAKSLTVAFELPPCSLTQDLLNFCPYQNPMLWSAIICSATTFPLATY